MTACPCPPQITPMSTTVTEVSASLPNTAVVMMLMTVMQQQVKEVTGTAAAMMTGLSVGGSAMRAPASCSRHGLGAATCQLGNMATMKPDMVAVVVVVIMVLVMLGNWVMTMMLRAGRHRLKALQQLHTDTRVGTIKASSCAGKGMGLLLEGGRSEEEATRSGVQHSSGACHICTKVEPFPRGWLRHACCSIMCGKGFRAHKATCSKPLRKILPHGCVFIRVCTTTVFGCNCFVLATIVMCQAGCLPKVCAGVVLWAVVQPWFIS